MQLVVLLFLTICACSNCQITGRPLRNPPKTTLASRSATVPLSPEKPTILSDEWNDAIKQVNRACPCQKRELCLPVSVTPKKEIYGFAVSLDPTVWRKYDWSKITTLVMWNFTDELMCFAHQHGVRLHLVVPDVPHNQLTNKTYRAAFIKEQVARVKGGFLDGINFDPEYPIAAGSPERQGLVDLVNETRTALRREVPGAWVTFDAAWATYCVDERCYDYKALADVTDFLFIMAYCIQGQIWGPCIAMSNTPFFKMTEGARGFFDLGIPPHKLVLGLPWFGYDYPCTYLSEDNVCEIPHGEYHGAPCSDWVGEQRGIDEIVGWLNNASVKATVRDAEWNLDGQSPQFNYKNATGYQRQVHYDDPTSLVLKYLWAVSNDMRGVGFWHIGMLDGLDSVPGGIEYRRRMWDLVPDSRTWKDYASRVLFASGAKSEHC